jgi:hypothetical protein
MVVSGSSFTVTPGHEVPVTHVSSLQNLTIYDPAHADPPLGYEFFTVVLDPRVHVTSAVFFGYNRPVVASNIFTILSQQGLLKVIPTVLGYAPIEDNYPGYWYPWGNYVILEPVPDGVYSLNVFSSGVPGTELTLSTDYPTGLPEEFHPCIVDFACYVLSFKLKKWQQAARFYNIYIKNLNARKKEYMDRKAERRNVHSLPLNLE